MPTWLLELSRVHPGRIRALLCLSASLVAPVHGRPDFSRMCAHPSPRRTVWRDCRPKPAYRDSNESFARDSPPHARRLHSRLGQRHCQLSHRERHLNADGDCHRLPRRVAGRNSHCAKLPACCISKTRLERLHYAYSITQRHREGLRCPEPQTLPRTFARMASASVTFRIRASGKLIRDAESLHRRASGMQRMPLCVGVDDRPVGIDASHARCLTVDRIALTKHACVAKNSAVAGGRMTHRSLASYRSSMRKPSAADVPRRMTIRPLRTAAKRQPVNPRSVAAPRSRRGAQLRRRRDRVWFLETLLRCRALATETSAGMSSRIRQPVNNLHKLDSPVSVVRSQCIAPVETLQHERNCAADHLFRPECERVPERDIQNSIAKYSCEAARYIGFISVRGPTRADRIDSCGRGSVSGRHRLVPIGARWDGDGDPDRPIASLRHAACPDRGRRFRAAGVRLFAPSRATGNQKNPVPASSGNAPAPLTPRPRPGA